jgi:hypothetical protein
VQAGEHACGILSGVLGDGLRLVREGKSEEADREPGGGGAVNRIEHGVIPSGAKAPLLFAALMYGLRPVPFNAANHEGALVVVAQFDLVFDVVVDDVGVE